MTGFSVDPGVLDQGAVDMFALGTRVTWAKNHALTYVSSSIEGGSWFYDAGAEINALGDRLARTYGHTEVRALFDEAGGALKQMARDYREIDHEARVAADQLADALGPAPVDPYIGGADGGTPSFPAPEYLDAFETPASSFEDFNEFDAIGDTITHITGFEWLGEPLEDLGLPNPVKTLLSLYDGDWPRLGRAIEAVGQLDHYWFAISANVFEVRERLSAGWSGVAADATLPWFDELQGACQRHSKSLENFKDRVNVEAHAMKSAIDLVAGLIEDIAAIIPRVEGNTIDKILDLASGVGKAVMKTLDLVNKAILALDAAIAAAMSLLTLFAQFSIGDGDFDEVATPRAMDVNG